MNFGRRLDFHPMRAPEDGAGAAAPAGSPDPGGAGGQATGGEGSPSPYRPEGLPDHLYGASDRETLDKVFGAYKPAREAIARMGELGELPKDAGGYKFEPSDKLKPYLGDLEADPVFKLAREAALKSGIREKQFGPFIGAVMEAMIDGEMVQPPVDLAAEKAALVPDEAKALDENARNAAVDRRVRDNHAMLEAWKARGLSADSAEALGLTLDTAAGSRAIEWFAAQMKTPQPSPGGAPAGSFNKADVEARSRDPRGIVGNAKYDPTFAAETDRMWQTLYPN